MDVEILEKKENTLLDRTEVRFKVAFQGATPNRKDVAAKLVAMLNSDRELTVLDRLNPDFGATTATGYLKVYKSKDAMKVEPAYVLKRNFAPKEKKAEGEAAPAKEAKTKEEKPKEEA